MKGHQTFQTILMMFHCRRFSIQLRILNNYLLQHLLLVYRCRFLSYCEIPADLLPVTIARHNVENCWSSSPNKRSSKPYPDFPNLVIIYPPFPEVIAFGQDLRKSGIGCHHPKLLVLLRRGSLCVVVTSANLVVEQRYKYNPVTRLSSSGCTRVLFTV